MREKTRNRGKWSHGQNKTAAHMKRAQASLFFKFIPEKKGKTDKRKEQKSIESPYYQRNKTKQNNNKKKKTATVYTLCLL